MAAPDLDGSRRTGQVNRSATDPATDRIARVVVPRMPIDEAPTPARRPDPVLEIEGRRVVMVTQFLSAMRVAEPGRPVTRLADRRDTITAALDTLFQGI